MDDRGDKTQLRERWGKCRQHVVADAQRGEAGHAGRALARLQHQEEDLTDVVVALEVVQVRLAAQDLADEVRELALAAEDLLWGLACLFG